LKLEIIPIGEVDDVERLAGIFGCWVVVLPMKYLGLSLGAPYKSTTIWNGIVENIERHLASWIFVEGREIDIDQKYFI
jgi:hypothetical protein